MNEPFQYSNDPSPSRDRDTYTPEDRFIALDANDEPVPHPESPMAPLYECPSESPYRIFSWLGFAMVLLFAGTIVGQYAGAFIAAYLYPDATPWWVNWVLSLVPLYCIGLPLMLIPLVKTPIAPHNSLCLRKGVGLLEKPRFTLTHWLLLLLMSFGAMYIGSYISTVLMTALETATGYPYANALESMVDESPIWMTLFATCIVAPLGEELIFRKLFVERARRFGDTTAILLSGLLFGLFHGNLFQFFYAFLLGVLLAYVYTRTNNLWWCVGIHGIINLMGGIIVPALAEFVPAELSLEISLVELAVTLLLTAWSNGMIAAAIVLFIVRKRRRAIAPDPSRRPTGTVFRAALLNPGMMVAVILMASSILISLILPVITFSISG